MAGIEGIIGYKPSASASDADTLDGLHASAFALASHTQGIGTITPFTSALLKAQVTDPTGTGPLVFANSPSLTTPSIGVATSIRIISTVATGTSPFTCASITLNSNLNADLLDGNHASAFQLSGNYITALTSDVTASGPGSVAATIAAGAVTYAKIQNISATSRILGRITAGAGVTEELTGANVRTICGLATTDSPQFANLILTGGGKIYPSADSTTGIQIAQADGTVFGIFDTTNKRMSIGGATVPGVKLYVIGGHIGLDNTYYLEQKDSGGTLRNVLGMSSSNVVNLVSGSNGIALVNSAQSANIATITSGGTMTLASGQSFQTFMAVPAAPTGIASTSGGSMADGTYYYVITGIGATGGETTKGTQSAAITITGGGGSGSIALTITPTPGATSHKIYRTQVSGTYTTPAYITALTMPTATYTDVSLNPTAGAPPAANTAYIYKLAPNGTSWITGASSLLGLGTSTPDARLDIFTETTEGKQAVSIHQNDADQAFVDFVGTESADLNNNISSYATEGGTVEYVKVEFNGTARWIRACSAPTA